MPNGTTPIHSINDFRPGDSTSFDQTFRRYYPALCLFAQRFLKNEEDARDLVQDCFVKLWHKPRSLANPAAIQSYLYMMVRNACIDQLHRQKKEEGLLATYQNNNLSPEEIDEVIHAELIRQIHQSLEALPPKMKLVFKAIFLEGKSAGQVAREFQVSPKTIHKQRARAIALLKEKLRSFFFL